MKKVPIFDKFVGTIILLGSVSVPGFIKIFLKRNIFIYQFYVYVPA